MNKIIKVIKMDCQAMSMRDLFTYYDFELETIVAECPHCKKKEKLFPKNAEDLFRSVSFFLETHYIDFIVQKETKGS